MSSTKDKIRIVLIGGSGYAGLEVLRWLERHPDAEVAGIFGPPDETGPITDFFPILSEQVELKQEAFDPSAISSLQANLAMLCVPHQVAMSYVPALVDMGMRVIDWSADYRLHDLAVYENWYCSHTDPERLADAVYGLPEFYRDKIAGASVVANPVCYPTCASLAIAPVLKAGLIEPKGIIVNAISGVSGAGRKPNQKLHFPERNENFEPYAVGGHRHMPEMEQVVSEVSGTDAEILFQPHLCPMDRGMLCSVYARKSENVTRAQVVEALKETYANEPFVRVREDIVPATKYVANTNYCDVSAEVSGNFVQLFSAIDNLLKGASTQAVQNMNIMFALEETTGLY